MHAHDACYPPLFCLSLPVKNTTKKVPATMLHTFSLSLSLSRTRARTRAHTHTLFLFLTLNQIKRKPNTQSLFGSSL